MQIQDIFRFIGILIFCIIPLIPVSRKLIDIYWGHKCKTWPSTKGRIIESEARAGKLRRTRRSSYFPFFADITYTYQVDGQQYEGSRIAFGSKSFDYNNVNRDVKYYRKGRGVSIYYHPDKPGFSTLETDISLFTYLYLFGNIVFAVVVIWIILYALSCEYSIGFLCGPPSE